MKSNSPMSVFLLLFFSCAFFTANNFAQCDGVFFKTSKRTVFDSPAAFRSENTIKPSVYKDMNGDGKIDLVGLSPSGYANKIFISHNDGTGKFGAITEIPLPVQNTIIEDLYIEDFNKDGSNDLFVQYRNDPQTFKAVVIFRNNSNGTYSPLVPTVLHQGQSGEDIINFADINNDNRVDLLTRTLNSNFAWNSNYRLGNADGSFGNMVPASDSRLVYNFDGDFNGDGKTDFAQSFQESPNQPLRIYYNNGNGNFTLSPELINIGGGNTFGRILEVADFNNDGKPDILAFNGYGMIILKNLGNSAFSSQGYPIVGDGNYPFSGSFHIADLNGDGFQDLLLKPTPSSQTWSVNEKSYKVFTNDGAGGFSRRDYNNLLRGFPAGDLDGDNKADLVEINNYSPLNYGTVFNYTQVNVTKNVCRSFGQTKIADFDGDGIANLAVFKPSEGRWRISTLNVNSNVSTVNWGLGGDITQPGDYDGDGKTDIAVYRPSNGVWYIINSSNGSFNILQFGISEDKPVSSDYDGDGKTDIAVYRPSNGAWYILYSETAQVNITQFGIAEDKPVQEDFDGDGKTDRAVYRPSTGAWYYLKSSDGDFRAIQWGISSDIPAPADYDGDGKADLAVFRPGDSVWYIISSFSSRYAYYQFGVSGDVPQPSDWNGDGIYDLGIYRPSAAYWYFSNTNTGAPLGESGEIPTSSLVKPQ